VTFVAQWQSGGLVPIAGRSYHDSQWAAERVVWVKAKAGCPYAVWFYSANLAALKETP
jgi:hypothetical protein